MDMQHARLSTILVHLPRFPARGRTHFFLFFQRGNSVQPERSRWCGHTGCTSQEPVLPGDPGRVFQQADEAGQESRVSEQCRCSIHFFPSPQSQMEGKIIILYSAVKDFYVLIFCGRFAQILPTAGEGPAHPVIVTCQLLWKLSTLSALQSVLLLVCSAAFLDKQLVGLPPPVDEQWSSLVSYRNTLMPGDGEITVPQTATGRGRGRGRGAKRKAAAEGEWEYLHPLQPLGT